MSERRTFFTTAQSWIGTASGSAAPPVPLMSSPARTTSPARRLWRALGGSSAVVIVGSGREARELAAMIAARPSSRYSVACLVSLDGASGRVRIEVPHRGARMVPVITAAGLRDRVQTRRVDRIVIAPGEESAALPVDILLRCQTDGCSIEAAAAFRERLLGRLSLSDATPERLLLSGALGRSRVARGVKRTVDVISATAVFILTAPLSLCVAVLIKLEDGGPIIFRQSRVGRHGVSFTLRKFRSMRENAEAETGPTWAQTDDPRVTRVGRWLRALRIDEIPQVWNVLRGEMSFVGPRPERPEFVATLQGALPLYDHRHAVRPGITGWAQVNFPYAATVEDARHKLEYDLYYLKTFSVWMDLSIMLRTVKIILFGWRNR